MTVTRNNCCPAPGENDERDYRQMEDLPRTIEGTLKHHAKVSIAKKLTTKSERPMGDDGAQRILCGSRLKSTGYYHRLKP